MDNIPGTLLIAHSLETHDTIIKFATESGWLLVGLVKDETTYLTQSGQLVMIRIKENNEHRSIKE